MPYFFSRCFHRSFLRTVIYASANEPILPQGADYGVGAFLDIELIDFIDLVLQSSVRTYEAAITALGRPVSGIGLFFSVFMIILAAIQVRTLALAQELGRVQQRFAQR